MANVARGVDSGTGINVLVDQGATGDMQIVKLASSADGVETHIPGDTTNGLDVDVTRIIPGTTATSLGKAEDAVAASGDTGVMALAVRRDTPTSGAAAGDYHEIEVDSLGRLWTTGTYAEDAVAASGDYGKFVLAVRRDTAVAGAAAGDYHELEVDALGKLWTAGVQTEDVAAASGDRGEFVLAVRRDAPTSSAAAGDYHEIQVDALGRLWVSGTHAEDAAHTSGDYGHFVLGVQSLARTSRSADNDYTPIAVETAGAVLGAVVPEANSAWAATNYAAVAAASGVIKASAGKLYGVTLTNDNAALQYIQFFNSTTVPADTTVPLFTVIVQLKSTIQLDFSDMGKYFSTGIAWSNSSTFGTKTIGAADCSVEARYL